MITSRSRDASLLLACVVVCFLPAVLGATFRPDDWYFRTIAKPVWNPPPWLFAPVWTVLYATMGVAMWRVARSGPLVATYPALLVFAAQLVLNALWSPLFFGLHRPGLALLDITLLLVAIAASIRAFRAHDRAAAWLLVPYLAWVGFATALNFAIWRLNA